MSSISGIKFTPEEEKQIEAAVEDFRRREREEMVRTEIQARIAEERKKNRSIGYY